MAYTVTEMLNSLAQAGVFAYVIPFLLIFALVFAIIQKSGILAKKVGENKVHNKAIEAIIAASIGLLALQFDKVPTFFASIFPNFGIGLAIFLVVLIFVGFFYQTGDPKDNKYLQIIGWVVAIAVVIFAFLNWDTWFGGGSGVSWNIWYWIGEYIWAIILLAIVVGVIVVAAKSGDGGSSGGGGKGP